MISNIKIRNGRPSDYDAVICLMDKWWAREIAVLQQRLFFDHFTDTIFIAEDSAQNIVGFINGFFSQSEAHTAYIHFVGVAPTLREVGLGRKLYEHFFDYCKNKGIRTIKSITSKTNTNSRKFHEKMGFEVGEVGSDKFSFMKVLDEK